MKKFMLSLAVMMTMSIAANAEFIPYDYTLPLVIFACFGIAALLLAVYLKLIDKKNGYGLEEPNIKE